MLTDPARRGKRRAEEPGPSRAVAGGGADPHGGAGAPDVIPLGLASGVDYAPAP